MSRLIEHMHEAYEATGYAFRATISFGALPGATTLTGGAVVVDSINIVTGVKVEGDAEIIDGGTIDVSFPAWSLQAGIWSVQVRATPIGYAENTVVKTKVTVHVSAAASP